MPVWEILAAFWHKIMLAAFLETPWTLIFNLPQKQYISQKHAMLCCVLDIASLFMLTPTIPCKFFLLCTWTFFVTSSQVRHRSLVRRKIKLKGGKRLKRETRSSPSLRRTTTSHQNPLHDQDPHHPVLLIIVLIRPNYLGRCVQQLVSRMSAPWHELQGERGFG